MKDCVTLEKGGMTAWGTHKECAQTNNETTAGVPSQSQDGNFERSNEPVREFFTWKGGEEGARATDTANQSPCSVVKQPIREKLRI